MRKKIKKLPDCTYNVSLVETVQKKYITEDNFFPTYVHDKECQVQTKYIGNNVRDCTFEVENVVDISMLMKKIVDGSKQDSINLQRSQVGLHVENISLLQDENDSNFDTDSNISKFESCESVEIRSDEGSLM